MYRRAVGSLHNCGPRMKFIDLNILGNALYYGLSNKHLLIVFVSS